MAFVEMDFASGGDSMKDWQKGESATAKNHINIPTNYTELLVVTRYSVSGTCVMGSYYIPKIVLDDTTDTNFFFTVGQRPKQSGASQDGIYVAYRISNKTEIYLDNFYDNVNERATNTTTTLYYR